MSLNWIEHSCHFSAKDPEAESYFDEYQIGAGMTYAYGFRNIPQIKKLLEERTGDYFSENEKLEIAREIFRNKPEDDEKDTAEDTRKIVDFIYQF